MPTRRKRRFVAGFDLRLFFGKGQGPVWLVNILNKYKGKPWADRLSQLVSDINEVHEIAARNRYPTRKQMLTSSLRRKVAEMFERIDSQLAKAQFGIKLLSPTKQGWQREWRPRERGDGSDDSELALLDLAIAAVSDLAAVGELSKIRQCEICHRWLASRRREHSARFCSDDCRDAHYRRSPERKEYMRKYLARLEEREEATAKPLAKTEKEEGAKGPNVG